MPNEDKTSDDSGRPQTDKSVQSRGNNMHNIRLFLVLGKGGTGKTSFSIALALAARRQGKQTLIVETGEADSIGRHFNRDTLPASPVKLTSRIWGARVNPKTVLKEYIYDHIDFTFLANRITRSRLFDHLMAATPGLKEAMTMGQIWRWEQEHMKNGKPRFDRIVVDAPATGHGLSLIQTPRTLIKMLHTGPVAREIRIVQNLLTDSKKTALILVTLPEELPVKESLETCAAARDKLRIPVRQLIINAVYPDFFSIEDKETIQALIRDRQNNGLSETAHSMLESASLAIKRCTVQQGYINQIHEKINLPVCEIPFFFTNNLSMDHLEDMASILNTPDSDTDPVMDHV